ncbi:MAG TPA: AMP-binding protein [Kofleriaceae bacterium]|nr:AMP-binding protein [Kofleriaceae bacterium]
MTPPGSSNGKGNGADPRGGPAAADAAAADAAGRIDVAGTFDHKNVLLIGSTGFVGKVALSMLLRRYPNLGRVYVLVRPGAGATPEDRFFDKVVPSPAFDPVREMWRDGTRSFLREKVVPVDGDVGRPLCNFTDAVFDRFAADGGLDVIVNSAGLVTFTPSLESAIRINTLGAMHALEVARRAGAGLVHVSTCYVAGRRDGEVWEDEPVVGYFPKKEDGARRRGVRWGDFDAAAELSDCQRVIEDVKNRANDRVHISEFRERAARLLRGQGRDPDDEGSLRLAVARERKLWVHERLTRLGLERAEHWGWTNTYTYTKSLGEQLVLNAPDVRVAVVRPAIVESAVRYPFPGWNEGFNTTAPLVYLMLKGHRQIVADHTPLDIIPVDYVAAGMIMAAAAVVRGEHQPVYQLASSGVNPVSSKRLTELTALAIRQHRRRLADDGQRPLENRIRARLEGFAVDHDTFQRKSAPRIKRLADRLLREIDERVPRWGAPRVNAIAERVKDELSQVSEFTGRVNELMDLFKPFTFDCDIIFRSDNVSALHRRLAAHDREALPWDLDAIDWRRYWLETHFPGLVEWVFPVLDDEFGKRPRAIYTYKDLLELFDSTTKLHRHRVAMRLLPADEDDGDAVVYTYERVQDMAAQAAAGLRERGVAAEDRVLLMSENRPEWGISYFGILKAGATAVPLDHQLSLDEVARLAGASGAVTLIASAAVIERLGPPALARSAPGLTVVDFDDLLVEPSVSPAAIAPARKGDQVASIIYTSGTTGSPKGVMLSHKNFTSMVAKLSSLFHLYRHDGLLSVLPLHHTFEFSTGLLMPLVHGAQVTYLEEINSDNLARALKEGGITGMVGVPALWQLLHRKITKRVSERGPLVERAFDAVVDLNRALRERMPYGIDLGKVLFFPVHRELGGRLRLLISGGSALSPDVMKDFLGLGFKLFEGYGMTEASPVITTQRPGEKTVPGSVGRPLPGIDVKIAEPDDRGVGEVLAKGPNVMLGYYRNQEATAQVLRDGWLHTGDLGRIDEGGQLVIVGRKKEMILGPSGENVYPDELEELYRESPHIKEVSVVGLPSHGRDGGETVAALVVPDYEAGGGTRDEVRERVREHMRQVSHKLPFAKRVRVFHLVDHDLPKTATRKVKRREVVVEVERLERAAHAGSGSARRAGDGAAAREAAWVREVIAQVAQKPASQVVPDARLADLGFDSLMFTELGVALEAAGVNLPDPGELTAVETVADLEAWANRHLADARARERAAERSGRAAERGGHGHAHGHTHAGEPTGEDDIHVPRPLVRLGRRALRLGQRALYERLLDSRVSGRAFVPPFGGYIVVANHSSHLDMGLVKHALGESGPALVALAAKDYFFEDPVRRMYFENFTNLVPMERHGSLRESLRLAGEVIRDGYILLIFPEGTRSDTGVMTDFKPSIGYLALANRCGILPMYLAGTHDAMPKGAFAPHRNARVQACVGPFLTADKVRAMADGQGKAESYRRIASHVEVVVRGLCPREYEWTLGESGRAPAAAEPAREEAPSQSSGSAPHAASPVRL